ncbi:energy transducer TonB family protein [Shewanella kaireitica]|uniref:energy transducer TonB family protein n=1 Tax=Shewanella kaireitica TaxID=212021 RepID=UPI003D1612FA
MNFVRSEILKRKHDLKQAKIRRHQGNITVAFTLTADGDIENIDLLKKSPSKYLNKSVRKLLACAYPLLKCKLGPPFPKKSL